MYRQSEAAQASLDRKALGYITKQDFVANLAVKRAINWFNVRYSAKGFKLVLQDIMNYVEMSSYFKDGMVSHLKFKEHYFPS